MTCRLTFIPALALACTLIGGAHAQRGTAAADYPGKPIRLIVPVAYGGGTDIIARLIGQGLNDSWGQPVIVDNRPEQFAELIRDETAKWRKIVQSANIRAE